MKEIFKVGHVVLVVVLLLNLSHSFQITRIGPLRHRLLRASTDEITSDIVSASKEIEVSMSPPNEILTSTSAVDSTPKLSPQPVQNNPNIQYDGSKREYKPRNSDGSLREFTKKEWKPKDGPKTFVNKNTAGSPAPRPAGGSFTNEPRPAGCSNAQLLNNPQLLIRFRVPRIQTAFKKELLELQETYKKQAEASRPPRQEGGYSRGGNSQSDNKADYYDKFLPPPPGGDAFSGKGPPRKKDGERKGSEGGRPKTDGEERSRSKKTGPDVEEDDGDYEQGEGYYGEEERVGLSSVPFNELKNMEKEGYSLEEMQMTLYGEYGVKVSVNAIRRRLIDESKEKRSGRTGKTRRDRFKARNNARNPVIEKAIVLPESGSIQIVVLANMMEVGAGEVIKHLMMNMGVMASMTQNIDNAVARSVCQAFGKTVAGDEEDEDFDDEDDDEDEEVSLDGEVFERVARSPIVTIMGHVDHGKTSLLDKIRSANVAGGEAGGITQGVSAFKVNMGDDRMVTFMDTPGHAAFSEMRKRGANVTDIVVLVVAADDGIMEQTKECINAAKAANCPIVVAVNKIDKEGCDPQKVITDLMSYDVLVEAFGGEVQCAMVSAKQGTGIDDLLAKIQLQAELMNLRAPTTCRAEGTIIESRVDKGLGTVVTALIQKGTLKIGDFVLAGPSWGKVRRLISDQGKDVKEAGPSTPVQVVGMSVVPAAGDKFTVTTNEAGARDVAESRQRLQRQALGSATGAAIIAQAAGFADGTFDNREIIKVPVLLKADVSGSVEAIRMAVEALQSSDKEAICKVDVMYAGVGDVTSSDVSMASAAKAKVIAFNVAAAMSAMDDARGNNVNIGYYNVVYDLLDELAATVERTLAPPPPGNLVGRAEIKKVFKLGKVGKIAGCMVTEGVLRFDSQIRVMRGKRNVVHLGKFSSLKIVKDVVQEVSTSTECGVSFEDFQDFEEEDVIECFTTSEE